MSFRITEETPYTDPHSRGTGSIVHERNGYILRTRGEHNRMVRHDYRCPVHGLFEAMVPSGDVPDIVPCNVPLALYMSGVQCGMSASWQSPNVAQGWTAGTVKT